MKFSKSFPLICGLTQAADKILDVKINGETKQMWTPDGQHRVEGGDIYVPHNSGLTIRDRDSNGQEQPDFYWNPNLLGGSVEFDIDLSKISCSCNMAFYLTLNPGYDTNGNPVKNKWGKYECSA